MKVPLQELYKIEGEAGPLLERTKAAMEWLLSPHAKGIGEGLLRDAHTLHQKPVTIEVIKGIDTVYTRNNEGLHKILFDPEGTPWSPESLLAHELTHAGQNLSGKFSRAAQARLEEIFLEILPPYRESISTHIKGFENTPYHHEALRHQKAIQDILDTKIMPKLKSKSMADPLWAEYIEKCEAPAVANQNKVAYLRGEPELEHYMDSTTNDMKQSFAEMFGLSFATKKFIPPTPATKIDAGVWQTRIKNGPVRLSRPEHPLIARFNDDGLSH